MNHHVAIKMWINYIKLLVKEKMWESLLRLLNQCYQYSFQQTKQNKDQSLVCTKEQLRLGTPCSISPCSSPDLCKFISSFIMNNYRNADALRRKHTQPNYSDKRKKKKKKNPDQKNPYYSLWNSSKILFYPVLRLQIIIAMSLVSRTKEIFHL